MAKKDLALTKEATTINSRSQKKVEHEKALKVLDQAKKLNRPVVYLKKGESEYSKSLNIKNEDLLTLKAAAEHIGISYHSFSRVHKKVHVPYMIKNGNRKLFLIDDLEKLKPRILQCLTAQ